MSGAVSEIEDSAGIDGITHKTSFEMEVRTCATTCAATEADWLTGFHYLIRLNEVAVEVTIDCFEAIRVADDDIITITASLIIGETHLPGECGIDGIVGTDTEVDTLVHTTELGAITIVGSNRTLARDTEVSDIDYFGIGDIRLLERVDALAIPALGIDIGFRLDIIHKVEESILLNEFYLVVGFRTRGEELFVSTRVLIASRDMLSLQTCCTESSNEQRQ